MHQVRSDLNTTDAKIFLLLLAETTATRDPSVAPVREQLQQNQVKSLPRFCADDATCTKVAKDAKPN